MHIFLETERLLLRQFTVHDLDLLVELGGDPRVMRYITGGATTPRDAVEGEVLPAFLGYYERFPGYGFWAAIEKLTGDFLGWFHYRPAPGDPLDQPELGYRLRSEAWGKGYATEGSRELIAKGFAEFGVQRVVASTMAVNTASRRVMEKSGMRLVRTFTYKPDKVLPDHEVVPDSEIIGWCGACGCGWRGEMWERTTSPADADLTHRRDYVPRTNSPTLPPKSKTPSTTSGKPTSHRRKPS